MIKKALFTTYLLANSFHGFATDSTGIEMEKIERGNRNLSHVQRAQVDPLNCIQWCCTKKNRRIGVGGGSSAPTACCKATTVGASLTGIGAIIAVWGYLTHGRHIGSTALSSFNDTTDLGAANFTTMTVSSEEILACSPSQRKRAEDYYDENGKLCYNLYGSYVKYFMHRYAPSLNYSSCNYPLVHLMNVALAYEDQEDLTPETYREDNYVWLIGNPKVNKTLRFSTRGREAAVSIVHRANPGMDNSLPIEDLSSQLLNYLLNRTNPDVQDFVSRKLHTNASLFQAITSLPSSDRKGMEVFDITGQEKSQRASRQAREANNQSWGRTVYNMIWNS